MVSSFTSYRVSYDIKNSLRSEDAQLAERKLLLRSPRAREESRIERFYFKKRRQEWNNYCRWALFPAHMEFAEK